MGRKQGYLHHHANRILHMLNEKTHTVKLGWGKTGLSGAVGVEYINRHLCEQLTGLFYIGFFSLLEFYMNGKK